MTREEFGQLLNLHTDIIPATNYNRPGTALSREYLTIHNTANGGAGADARAHARFIRKGYYEINGEKHWVSWHYTVDDKEVIKHVPINEVTWHAGATANRTSIAIEICEHAGIDHGAANLRAARLVAVLLYDFKMALTRVKSHNAWTGKNCPHLLLPDWQDFIALVARELASIDDAGPLAMTAKAPDFTTEAGELAAFSKRLETEADLLPRYDGPVDADYDYHPKIPAELLSQ